MLLLLVLGLNGCMVIGIGQGNMGFSKLLDFVLVMVLTSTHFYDFGFQYGIRMI